MIVLDTSALVAVHLAEAEAPVLIDAMRASPCHAGAPTVFEYLQVMGARHGDDGIVEARALLAALDVAVEPWTRDCAELAARAFLRFGRGRGHPAGLNFGDCMAYATAQTLGAPLLYKGDDFARTDIRSALGG